MGQMAGAVALDEIIYKNSGSIFFDNSRQRAWIDGSATAQAVDRPTL
jgi:hypothetical protein